MKLNQYLNELLSDLQQMLMLTYQVHWYMRGKGFLNYHPMLDSYIKEYQKAIDKVAEANITYNGSPVATLQEVLEVSNLNVPKADFSQPIENQLKNLCDGLYYLKDKCQEGIDLFEDVEYTYLQDMCSNLKFSTMKHIWMLEAELNN